MIRKMTLDPDADGTQWLYRGLIIMEQKHLKLLPYACYDKERCIGTAETKKRAKEIIDDYFEEKT